MHIRLSGRRSWHAVSEKLRATLVDMKKAAGGDAERPKVAWATMLKLVGNVVKVCALHKCFVDVLLLVSIRTLNSVAGQQHQQPEGLCDLLHRPDDLALAVQNPSEEKYRRINLANAAIQSRVASLPSSVTFFELLGFQVS